MRVRNFFYDRQWLKTTWLEVPVISVGNLTVGGTGKTPTVIMIAKMVASTGRRPGVIMRGYGQKKDREADEVVLLKRSLGGEVPVVANPDRLAGGREAIDRFGAQVLIADDAFQHRRLGRDLDLCLVDAGFPFGGGRVLPAGRMREPLDALKRADIVIITRSNEVSTKELADIQAKIREYTKVPILRSQHRISGLVDLSGNRVKGISGQKVLAFSGIGRNESFFETVRETGAHVVGTRGFADHHYFTDAEIKTIHEEVNRSGAQWAVCTMKDLVRMDAETVARAGLEPQKVLAVDVEIELAEEEREILKKKIEEKCKMQFAVIKMQN
jgi:tetraacyldisaccharide 4'-kinase